MAKDFTVYGIPEEVSGNERALFKTRLRNAFDKLLETRKCSSPVIVMGEADGVARFVNSQGVCPNDLVTNGDDEDAVSEGASIGIIFSQDDDGFLSTAVRSMSPKQKEKKDKKGEAWLREPLYDLDRVRIPQETKERITTAVRAVLFEQKIYYEWNLRSIEPNPKTILNFYGPSGNGKTMAAHGVAKFLGKKIMIVDYAEVESKYHGEGPQKLKAFFALAQKTDAILFFDEADSLLSKRLTDVTQGSEQAINSMRSQLLICLEDFHGVVIFATNLVENYDKAFLTRVEQIHFPAPDEATRCLIWKDHLVDEFVSAHKLDKEAVAKELAHEVDGVCGRDIRNAIVFTGRKAAVNGLTVDKQMLLNEVLRLRNDRAKASGNALTDEDKERIDKLIDQEEKKEQTKPDEKEEKLPESKETQGGVSTN